MTLSRSLALHCGGLIVLTSAVLAAPATASEFRYWTYWTSTTQEWSFSPLGPAFRPADEGIIEGWRLAVTGVDATTPPRVDVADAYDRACGDVAPQADILRIAVVLDYGTAADAPADESPPNLVVACAEVADGSTGFDALRAITEIRSERGFVCGLSGYPATGCGRDTIEQSTEPSTEPSPKPNTVPTTEPGIEPTVEPSTKPSIEPTVEPRTEPSPEPAAPQSQAIQPSPSIPVTPEKVAQAASSSSPSSGSGPLLAIVVLAGIIVLGVLAWTRSRGRR